MNLSWDVNMAETWIAWETDGAAEFMMLRMRFYFNNVVYSSI